MTGTDWQAAARYLQSTVRFGTKAGLHRIDALLDLLDRPEQSIPHIVHIGGTNGKGSVAAYLASILETAGWRVARFTSPHLIHHSERIVIDGTPIDPEDLAALLLDEIRPVADKVASSLGEYPTFFEVLTAAMYCWSRQQKVDWLIQEVGLGGKYDATNVIGCPDLAVITNVELDHTSWLGHTVPEIAADKAYIIKPGGLALTAATGEARAVIQRRASAVGARLFTLATGEDKDADYTFSLISSDLRGNRFSLDDGQGRHYDLATAAIGSYQAENAALAVAAVDLLTRYSQAVDRRNWLKSVGWALLNTYWPGRMDLIPGQPMLLIDGAHNKAGMTALRRSVEQLFPGRPVVLLLSLSKDRDPVEVFSPWFESGSPVHAWAVVPIFNSDTSRLANKLREKGAQPLCLFDSIKAGFDWVRSKACSQQAIVVACGSLYLAGELLTLINPGLQRTVKGRSGNSSELNDRP